MIVVVRRDGGIYFGSDQVTGDQLSARILESLRSGSERKIYIEADARVRYSSVEQVLDSVRRAGLQDIAFLVEQRAKMLGS